MPSLLSYALATSLFWRTARVLGETEIAAHIRTGPQIQISHGFGLKYPESCILRSGLLKPLRPRNISS